MALYVNKKMDVLTFIWFTSHVDKIIFSCINFTRTTKTRVLDKMADRCYIQCFNRHFPSL